MYGSVKPWINLPAVLKPFDKRTGAGTKIFKEPVDIMCYAEGKVQVVKDNKGIEVVSNKQLYLEGDLQVNELDNIIFEGSENPVIAIGIFYRNGIPDLKVVYV